MNTAPQIIHRLVAFAAILCLPLAGSAQVLLSSAEFAILGGTAITVGGPGPNSILNGHVGLSPGATSNITGFPPGIVAGITPGGAPAAIIATGGATSQAQADLVTARNALFAMPQIPANDLSNLDLGTLAALGAGVYFSTSASNQTGAIVLDANFQNGVAWVFNFSLSLTTAANSTITFINLGTNGGSDNGLFWNAASAITIGDNNTIVGNYLAGTSISFTGITTTLGSGGTRALAGAAVSFAGPGALNPTGGPGGGDFDGGLMYNPGGQLVPIPQIVHTGNVLLSNTGAFVPGVSGVTLVPGTAYPATTLTIDGISSDGGGPASLTVTTAEVTLTGLNTYTGGTIVNGGSLIAASTNLPTGGPISLNASTLTFNQLANGTFSGVISGDGAVNKQGAGVLTLTAANTYTGATTVSGGTLGYGANNALASGPVTVNGGTLAIGTFSDTVGAVTLVNGSITGSTGVLTGTSYAVQNGSVSAILGGTGALTKSTAGTVALTGANTYSGGTAVNGGTLVASTASLPTNGAVALNTGTLAFNQPTNGTFGGVISGNGVIDKQGAGALTLSGANTYTGGTTVSGGTLIASTTALPASGPIALNTGTLTINQATNGTLNGVISGDGSVIKQGTGVLTLAGTNTYTGVTTVSGGTVSVATIGNGGVAGNLGAATSAATNLVLDSGSLQYTGATAATDRGLTLAAGTTNTVDVTQAGTNLTVSGATANTTGALTKTGAGTLTLAGANLNTGLTTVSAGTLGYGANNALASGPVTVDGGTLAIGTFSDTVGAVTLVNGSITGSTGVLTGTSYAVQNGSVSAILGGTGALTKSTVGTVTLSGANTYTGGTTVNAGTLVASSAALPANGAVALNSGALTFNQPTNGTFSGVISGPGVVNKQGAGVLTLSGTNTYTGVTTVSGGTVSVATIGNGGVAGNLGAATNAATNLVLDSGSLQYTGATAATDRGLTLAAGTTNTVDVTQAATNLTVSGATANTTGALTKTGAGTLTLAGANLNTGLTTVSAGTLGYGANNALASGPVTVDGGTLALGTFSDTVGAVSLVNGNITGSTGVLTGTSYAVQNGSVGAILGGTGALTKSSAGTVTLTGANTYSGGTTISAGTLVASTATLPANGPVALNAGTLVFNQPTNGTFGGTISGTGVIDKQGAGVLTVANTTTAAVDVRAGSFFSNSGLGRTTIFAGALLGGNSTINGNLINNGTLSPGNSPGTTTINGNYTQSSTGNLIIELASATSFDRVVATGTASLAGNLQVTTLGGYSPIGSSFTFLTAAGGVTGTFGTFATNVASSAATRANVSYAPTSVTVSFTQLPFAAYALTPNQAAVAAAAQNVPALTTVLNTLPLASQFPAALNALSPQGYEVWSDSAFAHSTTLAHRVLGNSRAVAGHDEFYFEGGQRRGSTRADLDVGASNYKSSSGLVGGNRALNSNSTIGAYFDFGKTSSGLTSTNSQTTSEDKSLGLRAGWSNGSLFADTMVAYTWNRYESHRSIVFPGAAAVATSAARGHQWTTGITVGQHLTNGSISVSPFGGLLLSRWSGNGFTEQGAGAYSVTVADQSATSLRSQLGIEARVTAGKLQPHVRVAWLHEFSDNSRAMNASFGTTKFAVNTRRANRDSVQLGAGLDYVISPSALLYTEVTAGSDGVTRMISDWRVGASIRF